MSADESLCPAPAGVIKSSFPEINVSALSDPEQPNSAHTVMPFQQFLE